MTHRVTSLREPVPVVQTLPLARLTLTVQPPDSDPVQVEIVITTPGDWFRLPAATEAGWGGSSFGDIQVATRVIG